SAGFATSRPSSPIRSGEKRSARQASAIAAAASGGTIPARAPAAASARSASSIACSQASSPIAARSGPGTKSESNSPSDGKERGLPLALEHDVEPQAAAVRHGHEGRARARLERRQERVGRVRLLLVREVEAGHEPL